MSKRTSVVIGIVGYVGVVLFPFLLLMTIAIYRTVMLTGFEVTQLQLQTHQTLTTTHARLLTFEYGFITAATSAICIGLLAAVPFGLYLAVIHVLYTKSPQ